MSSRVKSSKINAYRKIERLQNFFYAFLSKLSGIFRFDPASRNPRSMSQISGLVSLISPELSSA